MRTLICGGGVIGACLAYFLARRGAEVSVIERTGIACAASGKSGGFLALDWCDGTPLEALARRSFDLHARLAQEVEGDWCYRRMTTFGGVSGPGAGDGARGSARGRAALPWLSDQVAIGQRMGGEETTAQVHPGLFTQAMMRAAQGHGADLRTAEVTGLVRAGEGRVQGVRLGDDAVEGDAVVIAMGPWSGRAASWLPLPAVLGLKGHSIVFETGDRLPAQALFLEHRGPDGASSPEIYPRSDGTTYVCALSSEAPLPDDPAGVASDPGAEDRLQDICAALSPVLAESRVLLRQACHRPITRDGLPLMGAVPDAPGSFVATGHSVWGILNAPATGEAMAELILDGRTTLDLSPFDPDRMPPLRG